MESIGIDVHKVNSQICVPRSSRNGGSKQIESDLQRCWESGRRREC
jgi:hypothetical protein